MPNTEPARIVRIRPSRLARLMLVTTALLAFTAIGLADLPTGASLAAALFTAFVAWQAWRRPVVVALRLNGDGRLELRAAGEDWQAADLLPRTSVTPWLCILAYRAQGKIHSLALYPDSLHPDDFRHLRVWLRWQARVDGDDRRKKPQSFAATIEAQLSRSRAHGEEEGMKTSPPKWDV